MNPPQSSSVISAVRTHMQLEHSIHSYSPENIFRDFFNTSCRTSKSRSLLTSIVQDCFQLLHLFGSADFHAVIGHIHFFFFLIIALVSYCTMTPELGRHIYATSIDDKKLKHKPAGRTTAHTWLFQRPLELSAEPCCLWSGQHQTRWRYEIHECKTADRKTNTF